MELVYVLLILGLVIGVARIATLAAQHSIERRQEHREQNEHWRKLVNTAEDIALEIRDLRRYLMAKDGVDEIGWLELQRGLVDRRKDRDVDEYLRSQSPPPAEQTRAGDPPSEA